MNWSAQPPLANGKVHSNNDDPTGRHPGKTQAAIPKAPNERADLVGQSYRERHRGQRAIGLRLKAGHMGAPLPYGVRLKRALDRGVVPHMGIRLHRLGYRAAALPSATYEEAPARFVP